MANVLYIAVLTVILAAIASARVQRNCRIKTCLDVQRRPIPEKHVSCLYREGQYGLNCTKGLSQGLTAEEKQEILRVHNDFRRKVASGNERRGDPGPQPGSNSIGPLEWSDELAELAQLNANQCNDEHDECRDTEKEKVGQNIAWTSNTWWPELPADYKSQLPSLTKMITGWYEEVVLFDSRLVEKFNTRNDGEMTGHYTQMIWGDTKRIGCGFTRYSSEKGNVQQLLVCNYGPTGNWIGEPVYKSINAQGRQPTSGSNGRPRILNQHNSIPTEPNRFPVDLNRFPVGPNRFSVGPNRFSVGPNRIPVEPRYIPKVSYYTQDGQRLCACAN